MAGRISTISADAKAMADRPKGWKMTTLGDTVEIIDGDRGVNYPKNNDFFSDGYCLFLNTKNVPNDSFSFEDKMFVDKEKDSKLRKGKLKRGDFVLTTRGTVGNFAFYSEKVPFDNIRINSGMVILRARNGTLNKSYLNFYLKSHFFNDQVLSLSSGTAQPQLPIRDLTVFQIYLPPLPEQRAIAAVLSSFDNKIELLREQNKTLEATAQAIFKEWFVSFNFPISLCHSRESGNPDRIPDQVGDDRKGYKDAGGKMINSELGKIPEGWRVGTVNDVNVRFSITYRCDQDDLSPKGKTPILDQGSNGLYGYTEREPDFQASTENPVIIFTNHTCNMWFINYPFCAIQNIIPFRGNVEYSTFFVFYMTLSQIKFIEYKGHWPDFEQKKYVIPKPEIANKFAEIVKPLQYKIWNNNSQIQTLSVLRDALLPKLMSGKIRVESL